MSSKLALSATSSYLALVAFALVFVFASCDDPVSDKKLPPKNESSAIRIAALRNMLVEFREQLVASGLMEEQDIDELNTLNGLQLMNKLVEKEILEETDVPPPLTGQVKRHPVQRSLVQKAPVQKHLVQKAPVQRKAHLPLRLQS